VNLDSYVIVKKLACAFAFVGVGVILKTGLGIDISRECNVERRFFEGSWR
jgi:hypothetical protein